MMKRFSIKNKETIATLITEEEYFELAQKEISSLRQEIEDYIRTDPLFLKTFKPYRVSQNAPKIIQSMSKASLVAGVGPMASVAGAIAYFVVKALTEAGAEFVVFDNGGDIAFKINRQVTVGIYTGTTINNLGFCVQPREDIFGICTSSASVGHSISFGQTDATTILSTDVILADAVATALGNDIKNVDSTLINKSISQKMYAKIEGILVIIKEKIGLCGVLPQLKRVNINYDIITKG